MGRFDFTNLRNAIVQNEIPQEQVHNATPTNPLLVSNPNMGWNTTGGVDRSSEYYKAGQQARKNALFDSIWKANEKPKSSNPLEAKYIDAKDALDSAKNNLAYATTPEMESQLRSELKTAQANYDAAQKEYSNSKMQTENLITEEQAAGNAPIAPRSGRTYTGTGKKAQNPERAAEREAELQQAANALNEAKTNLGYVTDSESEAEARKALNEAQANYDRLLGKHYVSDEERVGLVGKGAAKGWGADMMNAGATAAAGLSQLSERLGGDTGEYAGWATDEVSRAAIPEQHDSKYYENQRAEIADIQNASDRLAASGQADIEEAKRDTRGITKLAVDVGSNAVQMGMDGLAAVLTGGSSLASMYARSAGGAAREARQSGASVAQQVAYGVVRGGIEVATEKMFDGLAGIYGAGGADDVVELVIDKMAKSDLGRTALRTMFSGVGEAIEEGISGATEPLTQAIYKGIDSIPKGYNKEQASDVLYSMLVGFAMGGAGGTVNIVNGNNANANAELRQVDAIRNSLADTAMANTAGRWLSTGRDPNAGIRPSAEFEQNARQAQQSSTPTTTPTATGRNGRTYEGVGQKAQNPDTAARQAAQQAETTAPESEATTIPAEEPLTPAAQTVSSTPVEQATEVTTPPPLASATTGRQANGVTYDNAGRPVEYDGYRIRMFQRTDGTLDWVATNSNGVQVKGTTVGNGWNDATDLPGLKQRIDEQPANVAPARTNTAPARQPQPNPMSTSGMTEAEVQQRIADLEMALAAETRPEIRSFYENELNRLRGSQPVNTDTQTDASGTADSAPVNPGTPTGNNAQNGSGVPPRPPQSPTGEAADSTYEELGNEFGTIEPGENPVREANTPERTAKGNKVTQSVRTVMEADATPESRLDDIRAAVTEGQFSYVPIANADRAASAETKLKNDGWQKTFREWTAAVRSGQANADLVAEGAVLLNNAANSPECSGTDYIDLLMDYTRLSRSSGQALQAARILKTLSPEGKLYALQKVVQNMNEAVQSALTPKQQARNAEKTKAKSKERAKKVNDSVKQAKEKAAKTVFTFEYSDEASQMIARAVESKAKPKEVRNKTAMESLVDTIKKFATERVPSQRGQTRTMTATDLLTELSNNEEFAREAYELAQQKVRQDTKGTPSAANASEFSDTGMDLTNSNIVKRAVAESAVATNENRTTILNQSALGIGVNEIANSIAEDLIARTEASEDIANSIREASLDYVQEVLGTDTFETAEEADAASNERVEALVKKAMNQIGERYQNLAVSDDYTRQAALQAVHDILTEQYGVNGQSATRIAETIVENFDTRLNEAIQEELQNRFGEKEAQEIVERKVPDRLMEAINLGAFDSEYAETAINDIFGVEGQYTLDPALIEEYRQQTTDDGRDAVIDKMQQYIADQIPSSLGDKFTAIRYLNMLGNLKTQVRNVSGNTGMMLVQKAKNTVRSALETIASVASGGRYQKQYSSLTLFHPSLISAAWNDIQNTSGLKDTAMGEKKYSSASTQFEKGIEEKRNPFKFGDNRVTRFFHIANKQGPAGKLLSLYNKATSWAMEAGDDIFVSLNYTDALAGYLQAHKISADQWTSLVAEADSDPSSTAAQTVDDARAFAIKQAQEATFRDTNRISDFAQNFDRNWGKAKIITQGIAPFRKTPANVGVRMEEYSPLGFVNTAVKAIQAAKGSENVTGADVVDSLSKSLTGTGLAIVGFALAQAGRARTKSDDDKQEAFDKLRGLQDYSITVGDGLNLTLDWAVPASASIFMGVELFNLVRDGNISPDDAMKVIGNLTAPMLEMSMLSGLNDALNNISNFNEDTDALPQFLLNSAVGYLFQGVTNTLAGQFEQANEEYRQSYYTNPDNKLIPTSVQKKLAQAGNKTPGIDWQASDYIDAWGRKQKNEGTTAQRYANALLNPSYTSKLSSKETAIDSELQRLYDYGKDIDGFPSVLPQTAKRNTAVNGTKLSPEEYEIYATKKGQESLRLVTSLIDSREYKNLTDEGKAKAISECYSYAKYLADADISKRRGEESTNESYYNLMTGVDKSGTQYDKTALNASNFVAYTAFKIGLDDAVKAGDYKTIDRYVREYGRANTNLQTVLGERNSVVRALSTWKDAGLDSKTYYTVQKELVKSQQKLDKSQKTGSVVELDALANANLPEAKKRQLINALPDYGSKTVKGVYNILYNYGFNSKQINDFWTMSQDWNYKDTGDTQSSQKAGTLQPLEAYYAIEHLPGLTDAQKEDIYNQMKEVANVPYKINDWGNYTFGSERSYYESGRSKQEFGTSASQNPFVLNGSQRVTPQPNYILAALGIG